MDSVHWTVWRCAKGRAFECLRNVFKKQVPVDGRRLDSIRHLQIANVTNGDQLRTILIDGRDSEPLMMLSRDSLVESTVKCA